MSSSASRVLLVTGSNGGLGSQLVDDLLDRGEYRVACHYRSSSERLATVLSKRGLSVADCGFKADLTQDADVQSLVRDVRAKMGPIWGVVNLAGVSRNSMSWKMSTEDFVDVLHGNLLSTFLVSREVLAEMRSQGGGRIINTSSVVAHSGVVGAAHYCAAKSGIEGLTKGMALEVANKGITINALALGYFQYGMIDGVPPEMLAEIKGRIPVKRLGDARELAGIVRYLLGDESSFITGQVLHVNGGQYSA